MDDMLKELPKKGQKVLCLIDWSLFTKAGKVYEVTGFDEEYNCSLYTDDMGWIDDPDVITEEAMSHFELVLGDNEGVN